MVGALRRPVRIGNNYYLGINLPEQYGGHGLSHLDAVIVLEEFAKVSPAVAFPVFESCFGPILAIAHFAPETLRTRAIVQGALDYVLDYVQQRMRDAWGWGIAGGAIDIQKTNIASALIGRRFDQRR